MGDTDWWSSFEDSDEMMEALGTPPDLSGKNLSHLHVDDRGEGVAVAMGLDFQMPPGKILEGWRDRHFNAFEISLEFTEVQDIRIAGWARTLDCRVMLAWNSERGVDVKVSGTGESVSFTAGRARISRFRAYRASAASPWSNSGARSVG
jgi:hypothetical protein